MRAKEFIGEAKVGKVPKHAKNAMPGARKTRDEGGYDRTYHMNRMGMAMAMADGKSTKKVDMDSSSWVEEYNTIHPYTKEEDNMVKSAMKTIPTEHDHVISDHRSKETDDTHKHSPMMSFRGYKK